MAAKDRLVGLDVVRGIAIVGIFLVNILWLSGVLLAPYFLHADSFLSQYDKITFFLIDVFVENKFYAIFSILFGIGFYLFLNSSSGGESRNYLFVRRLIVLLIIGCMHAFLLWNGDILLIYSLFGFILLWLNKKNKSTILVFILVLFFISSILLPLFFMFLDYFSLFPHINMNSDAIQPIPDLPADTIFTTFGHGSYIHILRTNSFIWVWKMINYFYTGKIFQILAYFSFGLYMSKKIFEKPSLPEPYILLRSNLDLLVLIILGLLTNLCVSILNIYFPLKTIGLLSLLNSVLTLVGAFTFAIVYMELGILITRKKVVISKYFASYGRMALTNYLLQTIISIFIFYSIGFGLYGKLSITACILLALMITTCQIFISNLWLNLFNFGPIEWVWRMLTYAKYFPLKKIK